MGKPELVYLALGSNLGDRSDNLSSARKHLASGVNLIHCSDVFETPPWGITAQPRFLNQVISASTTLPPRALLVFLKSIENLMGRQEGPRFGPRIIDLDILLYGRRRLNSKYLQIPHPRMLERAFVLLPLSQIAPQLIIPGFSIPVKEMLDGLDCSGIDLYQSFQNEGMQG